MDLVVMVQAEGDQVVKVVGAAGAAGGDVVDADLFEAVFGAAGVLAGEVVAHEGAHALFLPAVGAAFATTKGGDEDGEGVDDGTEFEVDGWDVEGIDGKGGHSAAKHIKSFQDTAEPGVQRLLGRISPTAVP